MCFASKSPNALVVDNLPGKTLNGPVNCSIFSPDSDNAIV